MAAATAGDRSALCCGKRSVALVARRCCWLRPFGNVCLCLRLPRSAAPAVGSPGNTAQLLAPATVFFFFSVFQCCTGSPNTRYGRRAMMIVTIINCYSRAITVGRIISIISRWIFNKEMKKQPFSNYVHRCFVVGNLPRSYTKSIT